jgi:hypothetical protein
VVTGIIKHLGIALQSKDASFVACNDKSERDRDRESFFLKKKLALSMTDEELDQAVMEVCQKMKADRDKSRVAFYYLLAEKFNKLSVFASFFAKSGRQVSCHLLPLVRPMPDRRTGGSGRPTSHAGSRLEPHPG